MEENKEVSIEEAMRALERLEHTQEQLDRKTKDSEQYRLMYNRLVGLFKFTIVSFALVLAVIALSAAFIVDSYFGHESSFITGTSSVSESMEAGDNGILINGDGNTQTYSGEFPTVGE